MTLVTPEYGTQLLSIFELFQKKTMFPDFRLNQSTPSSQDIILYTNKDKEKTYVTDVFQS